MPSLSDTSTPDPVKMLFIGDSGSGKTGALASLAEAGYNLRILDFDVGLKPLRTYVKPEALARIAYVTLTDKLKKGTTGIVPSGNVTAFTRGLTLIDHWKTETEDFGPISTWTQKDILVIDSLSKMSQAALRYRMKLNGKVDLVARKGEADPRAIYKDAQDDIDLVCALLYSDAVPCHVIVCAHIAFIDVSADENAVFKGFPQTIGKALSPRLPQYFNTMLQAKLDGNRRVISTQPDGTVQVKCPIPSAPRHWPLATGLADFFKAYYA